MPRQELHSDATKVDQARPLPPDATIGTRTSEIVHADADFAGKNDYNEDLKFGEEPITIRLEPNTDPNAPTSVPVWVNGKGAEMFLNGKWHEVAYLPVGRVFTTKRKYVAVLASAKIDKVSTDVQDPDSERPKNNTSRFTSAIQSFSVIEDPNPRGAAWLSELRRRYF